MKFMLIINVIGGLGNQLYQYALYYYLESKNYDVRLDDSYFDNYRLHNGFELLSAFRINPLMATKEEVSQFIHGFSRSKNILVFIKKRIFDRFDVQNIRNKTVKWEFQNQKKNKLLFGLNKAYLIGYWTREDYFKETRDGLVKNLQFRIDYPLDELNSELLAKLKLQNTIAVHVRGGDYSDLGRLQPEYYSKAITKLRELTQVDNIIVFTNDEEFTKIVMGKLAYTIVDNNGGSRSFIDMYLMSNASHLVIANSTFSWWAAYLNTTAQVVLFPNAFHNITDFENWIEVY
jgi:hypothetical protein